MNERILVVDDEKAIADLVGIYLTKEGFEVQIAYSGADAAKAILEQEFDLALLDVMLQINPERIVYVSCDSATLARDLKILTGENKYQIKTIQPVDMFPQSVHVETVVLLSRHK